MRGGVEALARSSCPPRVWVPFACCASMNRSPGEAPPAYSAAKQPITVTAQEESICVRCILLWDRLHPPPLFSHVQDNAATNWEAREAPRASSASDRNDAKCMRRLDVFLRSGQSPWHCLVRCANPFCNVRILTRPTSKDFNLIARLGAS